MGFFRAWRLAKGVDVSCDSLKERLAREYFEQERYIRFLETNIRAHSALISAGIYKDQGKLEKLMSQYVNALWPEEKFESDKFSEEGLKILQAFQDKVFTFESAPSENPYAAPNIKGEMHDMDELFRMVSEKLNRKS